MKESKTYILFISNNRPLSLRIGRGLFCIFPPGGYIYIGSAKKNLKKRVLRHFSTEKKIHWHIDYLLAHTKIEKVYAGTLEEKELVLHILKRKDVEIPCRGFGATDSPHPSHLFLIHKRENIEEFLISLGFSPYTIK